MVLDSFAVSGLDRKVLKQILLSAGGSLSLQELKERISKVIVPQRPTSHGIIPACEFVNKTFYISVKLGSDKLVSVPYRNNMPDRSISIGIQSEHPSICEVIGPVNNKPKQLDPYDSCSLRLRFKAHFKEELHAHCDVLIREMKSGRLLERIRFNITIHR
jgi:hypothetical protein